VEDAIARAARIAAERAAPAPRPWHLIARPKQLPPDDPRHHLPDANGNACGCEGVDEDFNVHMMLAGRGLGKH